MVPPQRGRRLVKAGRRPRKGETNNPIENIMPIVADQSKVADLPSLLRRRSIADLLAPLDQIAAHSRQTSW